MNKIIIYTTVALLAFASIASAREIEYTFTSDLSVGSNGPDVVALQEWLISSGYDIPALSSKAASYGFFGTQTREAVRKFQADEGLPNTGYFGRLSRGRLHENKLPPADPHAPVINGVDAPTVLNVGETGTWTIRATDPQNGTLQYSVDWGDVKTYVPMLDCPAGYTCDPNEGVQMAGIQQASTFTHSYSSAGVYTVRFGVRNKLDLVVRSSATVKVMNANASPLNIISPNGGEVWIKGTVQTIKWNSPAYFRATYADLKLMPYYQPCPIGSSCPAISPVVITYPLAKNISINQNSFAWKVGEYIPEVMTMIYPPVYPTVPDGQYLVQICETGTNNCDSSDRPFTIKSNNVPQVTSPNGGEVWTANSAQYLRWSIPTGMDPMTRVDLYLGKNIELPCVSTATNCQPQFQSAYVLDKNIPITMAYNWLVATDINNAKIPAGNYSFRVCVAGSTTNCDVSDRPFTITQ